MNENGTFVEIRQYVTSQLADDRFMMGSRKSPWELRDNKNAPAWLNQGLNQKTKATLYFQTFETSY